VGFKNDGIENVSDLKKIEELQTQMVYSPATDNFF
jgi:hypothetical protein